MAKLEEVRETLKALSNFLGPAIPFVNSHLNSFFMDSLWNLHLSERLREDLDAISIPELVNIIKSLTSGNLSVDYCNLNCVSFKSSSFKEIICQIGQLLLASKNLSVHVDSFKLSCESSSDDQSMQSRAKEPLGRDSKESKWNGWKFDPFMSPKKMHEVEVMSEFINKVAELQWISCEDRLEKFGMRIEGPRIEYLIDVGSGKGYLSSFLVLLYNFSVLALDSSSVNTYGCTKRSTILQKNWSSFLRRARERKLKQDGEVSKRGKHWKTKRREIEGNNDVISQPEIEAGSELGGGNSVLMEAAGISESRSAAVNNGEKLQTVTLFVNDDLDLLQLLHDNFSLDEETHPSFGIIGLHTCGQLGVDSVKLFCNSKHAKFLANVPCCYHLLNEQFHKNEEDFSGRKYIPAFEDDAPGFPLSQTLLLESFYLGRNARMMSAQSLHRMSVEEDDLKIPRPLLYRALLQVLIRQKLGHTALENSVGRLGSKFEDFHQYFRKAWAKLQLDDVPVLKGQNDTVIDDPFVHCVRKMWHLILQKVSTEEIEVLYQTHGSERERFHKYYLLRALFAPLIEGCILLDRLAYLLEQGDVHEAFIVELFDPFLSPRCHALMAVR